MLAYSSTGSERKGKEGLSFDDLKELVKECNLRFDSEGRII